MTEPRSTDPAVIAECARTGHETVREVLGGLACVCGKSFEILFHATMRPPAKPR